MLYRYDCKTKKQMSVISEGSYGSLISFLQAVQVYISCAEALLLEGANIKMCGLF